MHNGYNDVFWIMEYAKKDSIGRMHSWLYGGIARSLDEVRSKTETLQSNMNCEVRAHRYSHALGRNA